MTERKPRFVRSLNTPQIFVLKKLFGDNVYYDNNGLHDLKDFNKSPFRNFVISLVGLSDAFIDKGVIMFGADAARQRTKRA